MDEAETLGDRIAVLSYGNLKCCGTPGFLKSSLGEGLHLYILKTDESGNNSKIRHSTFQVKQPKGNLTFINPIVHVQNYHVNTQPAVCYEKRKAKNERRMFAVCLF